MTECDTEQLLSPGSISLFPSQSLMVSCPGSSAQIIRILATAEVQCMDASVSCSASDRQVSHSREGAMGAPSALQGCCCPAAVGMSLQSLPESLGLLSLRGAGSSHRPLAQGVLAQRLSGRAARLLQGLLAVGTPALPTSPVLHSQRCFHVVCFFYQESRSLVSLTFSPLKLHENSED